MSRALNLSVAVDKVRSESDKRGARITSIERLYPSGTRVVYANADSAAQLARVFKSGLVEGPVVRTPLRVKRAG